MERSQEDGLNPMPSLHEQAMAIVGRTPELRPYADSVIKELMHHHILRALNDVGLFWHLTFIGGTCLRLCHGCARFSEDLDFRGGSLPGTCKTAWRTGGLRLRCGARHGPGAGVLH